ncbi:MAG: hypothetical protein E7Z97_03815 [Propionibacteriaceae bacterium]|uniref:Uncharacterized protein n=1 Tax=Propionibacterium ruminifibrarum TaxID=1962131 RepID=A0A375I190_9ACTN|nr:hypothetical protein [Propionibacterium ruminifibrarum]MBE6477189.1 hypothetical protein [Propionibacteriaceae bacterium]SPF68583.1 hypothetical protein PROPJV5_1565 [Propionibacterium ruminifibrarum]
MSTNGDEPRNTTTDTKDEDEAVDWRHPTPEQGAEKVPNGLIWNNPGFIPQTRRPVPTHKLDEDLERHLSDDSAQQDDLDDEITERICLDETRWADPADEVEPDEDILD